MPSPVFGSGTMLEPIRVGVAASLVNFIIHGLLLACVVRAVQKLRLHDSIVPSFLRHALVIVATGALLVAGHFAEVIVWAITYHLVGAAPAGADLVYLAFGNYTTLGYNDLTLSEPWRLLAAMTALNGIMLIGWSTALMIEILRLGTPAPAKT
jgi:Ion channel